MSTRLSKLAEWRMSEADWMVKVTDTATVFGWTWWHQRPARTADGWRTAGTGDKGCPDLIMVKDGRVLLVELKTEVGKLSLDQRRWITAGRGNIKVWRPSDWPEVLEVLGPGDAE